jgi:transposase
MNVPYEELLVEIRALSKENAELREKVRQLEERLKLNSKNSSKPPSTDQKGTNDVPKKKGGARPGHPGHFRPLFTNGQVDAFVNLKATNCPTCGETVRPSGKPPSIHQQVEIAHKPYIVTQYNREAF